MQENASTTAASEEPQMSEIGTIFNIFFEPENTFRDLKRKPRFILGLIIMAVLVTGYTFALQGKIGEAGIRSFIAEQLDKNERTANLSKEDKAKAVDMQMTISKYTRFAVPVFVIVFTLLGGLLYWLGGKAFGGTGTFLQNLSVWVYSGLPPAIIGTIASLVVLMFKAAEDIDLAASQRGLIQQYTNLGFLLGKEHPVLATVIATFDVFAIWGWILAAIGLSVVNRMSKGSSWALVIIIAIIGMGFRLLSAIMSGNPS